MNATITQLTDQLIVSYAKVGGINHLDGKNLPSKSAIASITADLLRLLESLQPITNKHLASDLAIAAVLAESAAKSGNWNVRVNLPLMTDFSARAKIHVQMETLLAECAQRRARIEGACAGMGAAP